MVGVLGPNPSVDTGYKPQENLRLEFLKDTGNRRWQPNGCHLSFSLEALEPGFQFKQHLIMIGKALTIAPAMSARRIDMEGG